MILIISVINVCHVSSGFECLSHVVMHAIKLFNKTFTYILWFQVVESHWISVSTPLLLPPWCLGVADQGAFKPTVTSLDTGVDELVSVTL